MNEKNRALSNENVGQVSGGTVTINDDRSITLTGDDAEYYLKHMSKKFLKRYHDDKSYHDNGRYPDNKRYMNFDDIDD